MAAHIGLGYTFNVMNQLIVIPDADDGNAYAGAMNYGRFAPWLPKYPGRQSRGASINNPIGGCDNGSCHGHNDVHLLKEIRISLGVLAHWEIT